MNRAVRDMLDRYNCRGARVPSPLLALRLHPGTATLLRQGYGWQEIVKISLNNCFAAKMIDVPVESW